MAIYSEENSLVPREEIEVQNFVRGGSCGAVFKGAWHKQGLSTTVAVKMIRGEKRDRVTQLIADLSDLSSIQFSNLCQIFGACKISANELWLILEYVNGPNLHDFLFTSGALPFDQQVHFSLQAASAVRNLHHTGIIHKDIKASSFLVKHGSSLVLTDFGLSNIKDSTAESRSLRWAAPEVIGESKQWTEQADIYSLGMLFYEIHTTQVPFHDLKSASKMMKSIKKGKRPKISKECPKVFADIIRSCWDPSINKRPTIDQLVDQLAALDDSLKKPKALVLQSRKSLLVRMANRAVRRATC